MGYRFKQNEKLIYIKPDGNIYHLHAPPTRAVITEEGFGMPPLEYVTDRAPFQHGDTVRSFTLAPRSVQLVILQNFCSRREYWDGRAALLDALRPNRVLDFGTPGKLLYYLANGQKRQLDVLPDSGPGFAPPEAGWRSWSFTEALRFVAHDPVWYDPAQHGVGFTQAAIATFPMTFPVVFFTSGGTVSITYTGTWMEYPIFVIGGPVIGLRIANLTTGDEIIFDGEIPAGMTMQLTLRGIKSAVRSDGVNMLSFLASDSDLTTWSLAPDPIAAGGVNQIQVTGSGMSGASTATMFYYNRYIGV